MRVRKTVLLSCVAASLVMSSGYAEMINNIVISDQNATGAMLQYQDTLSVTTSGSIKVSGLSAIDVNSTSTGDIENHGVLEANTTNGNAANILQSVNGSNTGNITNSGTMIVSNTTTNRNNNSNLSGIVQITDGNNSGNIINSGTITVTSTGGHAYGIYAYPYYGSATITNSGTIQVSSTSGHAYGIYTYSYSNGSITNSGTIQVSSTSGHAYGIYAYSYYNSITITNSGTITADIAFSVKGRGSSDGSSGTILNSGTINTNRFNAPYSTVTNSGTINLHNKAGQDGHSYAGAFNQRASGTLSTDANITTGGTSTHPDINATNVSIADSSTINVNVISASDTVTHSFLDNNGTVNGVVISQNSIDANVAKLNITDDSPILDFEAFMNDSNTSLSLKAVEASVIKPQDKPLVSVSTSIVGMETLNVLDTVVQARQNSSRGLGSGDIAFKDKHIWFKPFGMYTKQDDKDGIYGFDANTYGFGIGVDGEYKAGNRAGLAFFYSYANIDINYVSQSNDMNVFNLIVYGSNPIVDDKTMLFYQAGAGVQRNNAKRYVSSTTQTAKADFTSKSFYVQAKAARSYNINDKLTLAPAIKGVLRYFYTPSYIESGADIGGNNLHVDSASTTQVILGLLTNLEYKINDSTNFISNVALNYDFNNDANSVYASYVGGTVFTTKGIKNSAFNYELGLGVSKQLKKDLMFNVKYDLSGRGSDFINHAIMAKFKWTF